MPAAPCSGGNTGFMFTGTPDPGEYGCLSWIGSFMIIWLWFINFRLTNRQVALLGVFLMMSGMVGIMCVLPVKRAAE